MTAATIIRLPVNGKPARFGGHVAVRAVCEPWIGQNIRSTPRYHPGRRPTSFAQLAVEQPPTADDGRPDTWPGQALPDSDAPWPGNYEAHLRWRRFRVDPRPLRGILVRATRRHEGRFIGGALQAVRRVPLLDVLIDTQPPRHVLVCPGDLMHGWGAVA